MLGNMPQYTNVYDQVINDAPELSKKIYEHFTACGYHLLIGSQQVQPTQAQLREALKTIAMSMQMDDKIATSSHGHLTITVFKDNSVMVLVRDTIIQRYKTRLERVVV